MCAAIPGLLTEYQNDPGLWHRLVQRSVVPMRATFAAYVERTGRRPVGDVEALFDVMIGALFVRAMSAGAAGARGFAREVSAIVSAALGSQDAPDTSVQRVFGGQVARQALVAAGRTVEQARRVHSLHAYFLHAR